jgi:TonB family protein
MMRACLTLFICTLLLLTVARDIRVAGAGLETQQEQAAQPGELEEATELNRKVVRLYQSGKIDEALPLAKRVLQIREKALGKEHQLVIEALLNLGEVNLAKKLYREALSNFERALKINEKQAGADDPANIVLLDKVAWLSYMTGDFIATEKYYKRSLAISEKASGAESDEAAQSAYNLAEFYRLSKSFQKAEPLYQRALAIRDKLLKPDDEKLQRTSLGLTCLYYQSGQPDKLEALGKLRSELYRLNNPTPPNTPSGLLNGKAVSLPLPVYPVEAKVARATGVIVVKVTIDESGKVIKAEDLCGGNYWLSKAAMAAAYNARFSSTTLSGQPVKVIGLLTYRFIL